jgi:hypothetical protein
MGLLNAAGSALTGISNSGVLGPQVRPTTSTATQGMPNSSSSSSGADLTVPPLGAALTPQNPGTSTYSSTPNISIGQGTASQVGDLNTANSQNTSAATLNNGKMDPNDATNSASQLDAITSQNSPYIQLAEQQGLLTAASRGLENSSLGAGAAQASATAAAAPLAQQNASEAATAANQNAQLGTQASEFNSSQDAAAKELQAQLGTSVSQSNAQMTTANNEFNAQQDQAAKAANAAATNTMAAQTSALTEDMNKQDLSGTQAARLANIQAQSAQLIASNQSASSLYSSYMSSMSATMANKDIAPGRVADSITAMQSMLQSGLGVIDQMSGMSLDLTLPSTTNNGGGGMTTTPAATNQGAPKGTAPTVPGAAPGTKAVGSPSTPYTGVLGNIGFGRK